MGGQRRLSFMMAALLSLIPLRTFHRTMTLKDFSAADPRWPGVTTALQGPSSPEACSCPRQAPGPSLFQEPCSTPDTSEKCQREGHRTQAFWRGVSSLIHIPLPHPSLAQVMGQSDQELLILDHHSPSLCRSQVWAEQLPCSILISSLTSFLGRCRHRG